MNGTLSHLQKRKGIHTSSPLCLKPQSVWRVRGGAPVLNMGMWSKEEGVMSVSASIFTRVVCLGVEG